MALPDTSVKLFDSATMADLPPLSGEPGKLIDILDAALINGGTPYSVASLSVLNGVATLVTDDTHPFALIGTVGPVIRITGVIDKTALNGGYRIATVPDGNTVTFAVEGIANGAASGTITVRRAPAGWEKRYSAANKAVYARLDPAATAMLLRVDDTPAQYPTLIMYESMTDVDTGTGKAPVSGSFYFGKSSAANATARNWRLYSDGMAFYLFNKASGSNWEGAMIFGDPIPYKGGDAYHCLLHGTPSAQYNNNYITTLGSTAWSGVFSRSHTQLGAAVSSMLTTNGRCTSLGSATVDYPNPVDLAFHAWPVQIWESTTLPRAIMPGLYSPIHKPLNSGGPADGTIFDAIPELPGRDLMYQPINGGAGACAIDITGPWR